MRPAELATVTLATTLATRTRAAKTTSGAAVCSEYVDGTPQCSSSLAPGPSTAVCSEYVDGTAVCSSSLAPTPSTAVCSEYVDGTPICSSSTSFALPCKDNLGDLCISSSTRRTSSTSASKGRVTQPTTAKKSGPTSSTASEAQQQQQQQQASNLTAGDEAGIGIGVAGVALGGLSALILLLRRRKRRQRPGGSDMAEIPWVSALPKAEMNKANEIEGAGLASEFPTEGNLIETHGESKTHELP